MKKFILSVAVLLTTFSMNANAQKLDDSIIFHYTSDELYNMMVAHKEIQEFVAEEINRLMWNYHKEYDQWGNAMIDQRFLPALKGGLMDVINYLKQMKAEEDAATDSNVNIDD